MTQRTIQQCLGCGKDTIWENDPNPCRCYSCQQRRDESFAEPCITRIGESNGKAFVVYLRDGMKITVGRDKTTKGPVWLNVERQGRIVAN